MKKHILFLAIAALSFSACEEIPPVFNASTGTRKVLVEEFTGVRCVNCPAGSALIEDLLAANDGQLIAVSIHAGQFAPPYSNSLFDFRTEDGDQILSYLGEPFGYPTAVVNRKLFDGQFDLQLGSGDWAGYIAAEKATPPKVLLNIEPLFDQTSRTATVEVTIFVEEAIEDADVHLSLMLTESGVQDVQITPASATPQTDYVHKHILRDLISAYDGDPITESLTKGAEIKKTFTYTVPADWVAENCKLIAFVSLAGANKDILQAQEADLTE